MKKLSALFTALCLLAACPAVYAETTYEPVTITVDLARSGLGDKVEETFEAAPTRAVAVGNQLVDILLDLGLEDSMIAAIPYDADSEHDFPGRAKIPNVWVGGRKGVSREQLLSVSPDFLMGWDSDFGEDYFNKDFCQENGIMMYMPNVCTDFATMEDLFKDYETLGKIFDVQDTAAERIEEKRAVLEQVKEALGEEAYENPVTIFNYDSESDSAPFTACQGMPGDMFKLAGGISIFDDIDKAWATVSWEQVVERNPQVIIVNDYSGEGAETVAALYEKEALANVDAIVNQRVYSVQLSDLEGSSGSADVVAQIAAYLYPDKF